MCCRSQVPDYVATSDLHNALSNSHRHPAAVQTGPTLGSFLAEPVAARTLASCCLLRYSLPRPAVACPCRCRLGRHYSHFTTDSCWYMSGSALLWIPHLGCTMGVGLETGGRARHQSCATSSQRTRATFWRIICVFGNFFTMFRSDTVTSASFQQFAIAPPNLTPTFERFDMGSDRFRPRLQKFQEIETLLQFRKYPSPGKRQIDKFTRQICRQT